MRHNERTATAFPRNFVPNTPFPEVEPPRHTVVQADNKVSPPMVLALAFLVLFLMAGIAIWALWDLTGWSVALVTFLVIPAIGYAGFWLFVFANGDGLAWREITKTAQNQETAILEHADLMRNSEDHRHVEAMRSLDIQEQQAQIDGRLQGLQHQIEGWSRHMLMAPGSTSTASPAQYVAADPDKVRAHTAALDYALSLYHSPVKGGLPRTDRVHVDGNQPGKIKGGTPFSARGRWPDSVTPDQGKRAKGLLFAPDRGQPPVIVSVVGGYSLNLTDYPNHSAIVQKFA